MAAKGRLLLVIPSNFAVIDGEMRIDGDFANNVAAYLERFDEVVVASPVSPSATDAGLVNLVPFATIPGHERFRQIVLPWPYREDRYLRHRRAVAALLRREIAYADYLSISPHAPFDWSTLATGLARRMGRSYDMEADWDLGSVMRSQWRAMRWGLNKLRKYLWRRFHGAAYLDAMRHSDVALLQGREVFDAYKDVAPNPHKVLNVHMTRADRASPAEVEAKIASARAGAPLQLTYAGRCIDMKGPLDWIEVLGQLHARGVRFQASWFGDGDRLPAVRARAAELGIADRVRLPGAVTRGEALARSRVAHMFLFCHMTAESPRALVEALVNAAPLVGYGSAYSRDLVEQDGGGRFVEIGDRAGLADIVAALDRDREALAGLIRAASVSAEQFDRDTAIHHRIDLIRRFVRTPARA